MRPVSNSASNPMPLQGLRESPSSASRSLTKLAHSCLNQVQAALSSCQEGASLFLRSISKLSNLFAAPFIVIAYKCHSLFQGDQTPLLFKAAKENNRLLLQSLQLLGCDLNATNQKGSTPAHIAAGRGHISALEFLITQGCDLNAKDITDSTPAHFAAISGHVSVLEFLATKGCDLNAINQAGFTPANLAALNEKQDVVDFLARQELSALDT